MTPTTCILAGGLGTRMRAIAGDTPKALIPVAGRPFIAWQFDHLCKNSLRDIALCVGFGADQIKQYVQNGAAWDIKVRYSFETEPLGTAGALRNAQGMIVSDPFIVLNGDSFVDFSASKILKFHQDKKALITIVLIEIENISRYGSVIINENDEILNFGEKVGGGRGLINAGVYVINKEVLAAIPGQVTVSLEKEIFPKYVGNGLYGVVLSQQFIDIGTPESLVVANIMFQSGMNNGK